MENIGRDMSLHLGSLTASLSLLKVVIHVKHFIIPLQNQTGPNSMSKKFFIKDLMGDYHNCRTNIYVLSKS